MKIHGGEVEFRSQQSLFLVGVQHEHHGRVLRTLSGVATEGVIFVFTSEIDSSNGEGDVSLYTLSITNSREEIVDLLPPPPNSPLPKYSKVK